MFVESSDDEQIIERVAALDIGKAEVVCCVRLPAAGGERRVQEVSTHSTMVTSLCELANRLVGLGVERVVMEATSDYWRPPFYLFEAHGLDPWLVNAKDVKHLPGRPKTDRLDAVWLCKVAERQMLRPSFVPPGDIRQLRDLTRYRIDLVGVRTAEKNRVDKLLEDACLKLSVVASDIFGVSGRAMMAALITGERDPTTLADLARTRMRTKIGRLEEAFAGLRLGTFDDHHRFLLARMLARVDAVDVDIAAVDNQIGDHLAPIDDAVARLDEIPGIGPTAAAIIIAELGLDMTRFPTPAHLASWAKFAPGINSSAGKTKSNGSTGHGNRYLARVLGEGGGRSWPNRHLPRRPLPTHRPPTRQEQSHRRGRPLTTGDHLAPPRRPLHPLRRPWRQPLRPPRQHPHQEAQPRPPARSTRLPRHPRTHRLAATPRSPATCLVTAIFGLVTQQPRLERHGGERVYWAARFPPDSCA
jgi:transposase